MPGVLLPVRDRGRQRGMFELQPVQSSPVQIYKELFLHMNFLQRERAAASSVTEASVCLREFLSTFREFCFFFFSFLSWNRCDPDGLPGARQSGNK